MPVSNKDRQRAYMRRLRERPSLTTIEQLQDLTKSLLTRIERLEQLSIPSADGNPLNGSLRKGFPLDSLPKESPSLIPSLIRSLDSEFDEIWPIFPRRIGKGGARRAYRTARKKVAFDVVLAGIKRLAVEHQTTEPQFIPHPATWLNQERWLDEAPKPNGHATTEHKPTYGRIRDPTEIAKELGLKP